MSRPTVETMVDGTHDVVVSISGGKDSTATSLHLTELGIAHRRVFADTGWEHAATLDYIAGPLTSTLGPIDIVRGPGMVDLVRKKGMFPSRLARFCTSELKVLPIAAYLATLDDPVNVVGIRASESRARAALGEWEWSSGLDAWTWRPLLAWSMDDVVAIHHRHGLRPNPLYMLGASRVGCWPCIHARKEEIRLVAESDPARIDTIRDLERAVGDAAETRGSARPVYFHPRADGPVGIDAVVEWATTSRGGHQVEMWLPDPDAGCMRWGMCDTGGDQ